jgi:hypothetical protein
MLHALGNNVPFAGIRFEDNKISYINPLVLFSGVITPKIGTMYLLTTS